MMFPMSQGFFFFSASENDMLFADVLFTFFKI